MKGVNDMVERLKKLRAESGMTQDEFAKKLGVSTSIVKSWETGRRNPSSSSIYLIANLFHVRSDWLKTGNEPMRYPDGTENEEAEIIDELLTDLDNPLYKTVRTIMRAYIQLNAAEREIVKKFAAAMIDELNHSGGDA